MLPNIQREFAPHPPTWHSADSVHLFQRTRHEYVLVRVMTTSPDARMFWFRFERRPGQVDDWVHVFSSRAQDTALLIPGDDASEERGDFLIYHARFPPNALTFIQMLELLSIIHRVAPRYGPASFNCWWFCDTIRQSVAEYTEQGTIDLQPFGHEHWKKRLARTFADRRRTMEKTDTIKKAFKATRSWLAQTETLTESELM